jgi:hypothetical protein
MSESKQAWRQGGFESIEVCNEAKVAMVYTDERSFKHLTGLMPGSLIFAAGSIHPAVLDAVSTMRDWIVLLIFLKKFFSDLVERGRVGIN